MHRIARALVTVVSLAAGCLALLAPGVAASAYAATLVVQPGQSIQAALDAAAPGDTVVVAPGTYRESLTIAKSGISLIGSGPGQTVLLAPASAKGSGIQARGVGGVAVENLAVEGFPGIGVMFSGVAGVTVENVKAQRNGSYGIAAFRSSDVRFVANTASGSGEAGLYLGVSPQANATIAGNTSFDNARDGIFIRDSSHGTVSGNTLYGNCAGLIFLHAPGDTGFVVADWTASGNTARDNDRACPANDDGPSMAGVGIAIAGGQAISVQANVVTANRAPSPATIEGGIAVVSAGGAAPTNNRVTANVARDNTPVDLAYDGTGSGNTFVANACRTSNPPGLCA